MTAHLRLAAAAFAIGLFLMPPFAGTASAQVPAWVGTVTVESRYDYADASASSHFYQKAVYTLASGATDTSQTTVEASYDFSSDDSCIRIVGLGSGFGGGDPELLAVHAPIGLSAGYVISAGGGLIVVTTVQQGCSGGEPYQVIGAVPTIGGGTMIDSPLDSQFVLQGKVQDPSSNYCTSTACATYSFSFSLRRVNCTGAPDVDRDGLDACQELDRGSDPNNADTDGDGIPDGVDAATAATPAPIESAVAIAPSVPTSHEDPAQEDCDGFFSCLPWGPIAVVAVVAVAAVAAVVILPGLVAGGVAAGGVAAAAEGASLVAAGGGAATAGGAAAAVEGAGIATAGAAETAAAGEAFRRIGQELAEDQATDQAQAWADDHLGPRPGTV